MPILFPLVIPFFAFAAAFVLLGLSQTHSAQHGSSGIAGWWQFVSSGFLKNTFGQIVKASRYIISHFAAGQLNVLAKWLVHMGTLTVGWFAVSAAFSEAITEALERVEHRGDPKARAKAAGAATAAAAAAKVAHKGVRLGNSNAASLHHYQTKTDARIKPIAHATSVALPHDIARVRGREEALSRDQAALKERTRGLEHGAEKTWEWIRTHPFTAATGAFAAATAIALQRIGLGNLRCKNFTNLLKHYGCGFGTLLGRLLPLAVLLDVAFDFEDFCRAARVVAFGIGDAVASLQNVVDLSIPPLPPPGR